MKKHRTLKASLFIGPSLIIIGAFCAVLLAFNMFVAHYIERIASAHIDSIFSRFSLFSEKAEDWQLTENESGYGLATGYVILNESEEAIDPVSYTHLDVYKRQQQSMEELDLYGTVEAAVCCLDSINYLTDARALKRTLQRLHLFVAPGGVFLFDVNTPCKLRSLDGQVFLDEREDLYCVWRAEFDRRSRICTYGMDIFERQGALWRRSLEEHYEKAWDCLLYTSKKKTIQEVPDYGSSVCR